MKTLLKRNRNRLLAVLTSITILSMTTGCSALAHKPYIPMNESAQYYNYLQPSFSDYLEESERWLSEHRAYISEDHAKELAMNMPFEVRPSAPSNKAILFVHGLGDSPYSFSDLGNTMAEQGFYVQSLLLPGHGSKPEDLMLPSYEDWQTIVDHYAELLKGEYDEVWLGGFSTGANLITINTIERGNVDGLILVSPGYQSRAPILEKFAPFVSLFVDGYKTEEQNLARYTSAPINGAIAYSESAQRVRDLLEENTISVPALLIMSEADSVIDPEETQELFSQHFNHPTNQTIWYGESRFDEPSILFESMRIADKRISTGSHMSPLFAPSNFYYGEQAERTMCLNSMSLRDLKHCNDGREVWYSAWGYTEKGKVHARLTYNPYYAELESTISEMAEL
ncbi:carboxylesterase [Oleiphilus sp. HI0125]|uniref:alpha/beta hydrolase n=2 Tax=unclassified Oleiphilus TaxID=2631174 RepID=UPI000A5BD336|nr:alpha/beta fold hydrolase [Oleiphilus sp. HI0125]